MKKLITLVALLTCFMGAKAQNWAEVYSVDYSKYQGFPFYVMGYVPEWFDGVMTDFGAMFAYKTEADVTPDDNVIGEVTTNGGTVYKKIQLAEPAWHQYFVADGIPTVIDGRYKIVATVKASEAVNVNVNMGWGWGDGQQAGTSIAIGTDWAEVEWEYSGIAGSSCNLVAQPGTSTATIEWKSIKVYEFQKPSRPKIWQEWLTKDGQPVIIEGTNPVAGWMGDAETPWGDLADTKWNDESKNYLICAWGKEREVNMNDDGGWDPFPATIEQEADGNHYFIVHGKAATTEGDASAWDNQFWIESPKAWKAGTQVKIKFRYKASKTVTVPTQTHYQNPSNYLIWHAIGDVTFTEEWQDFEKTFSWESDMDGGWSVAFQLNQNDKEAIDFYFDDLSWQSMKLDEGLFIASANTKTGLVEYDYDNATEFVYDETEEAYKAVVGEKGNQSSWVNEVMISTVRGDDGSFKGATLKPKASVTDDPDQWIDYDAGSLAKIKLPAAGVWQVMIDTEAKQMNFVKIEGEAASEPVDVVTNPYVCTVNALERDWRGTDNDGNPIEAEVGEGQPWDNQFWIVANRVLDAGEETVVEFDYVATKDAKASTQTHAAPGAYIHWAAIGDVNFTTEEQHFSYDFTIPAEAAGKDAQSIAFNLAEIKEANDYTFKNFKWYLKSDVEGKTTENLINATGGTNFAYKVVGGQITYFETSGISNVTTKGNKATGAIYNIAGQKVDKSYKGLVIQNGKKFVNK
jgi:hypothetical protein